MAATWSDSNWPVSDHARGPSLDTWQQSHITPPNPRGRIRRKDASKAAIRHLIDQEAPLRPDFGDREFLVRCAHALEYCRTVRAYRDGNCGRYLARPNSCHVRLCPDCESARADRMVRRFDSLEWDLGRAVFWVLTVPNFPQGRLRDGYHVVQRALANVRRTTVFARVHGGVSSVESPWQRTSRSWNLHVNLLLDAPWILQSEMREAWRAATCNEIRRTERRAEGKRGRVPKCPHHRDAEGRSVDGCRGASWVWVETIHSQPGTPERTKDLREVFKYVTKGFLGPDGGPAAELEPAVVGEVLLATRGRRLVNGFGSLRGVRDDDRLDEIEGETLTLEDVGIPDLVGLPRVCPFCAHEALWELAIEVPRRDCTRAGKNNALTWYPPPSGRLQ
jgi:hypothetical protein